MLAGVIINKAHPLAAEQDDASVTAIAAALESHSAHPLASAFRPGAAGLLAEGVADHRHLGLEGLVEGHAWRIGSAVHAGFDAGSEADDGSVWLADDDGWLARFEVRDRLREGGARLVKELAARGVRVCIASGDAAPAVKRVARELAVEDWQAGLSPQDKMALVESLQQAGRKVLMVGDGVNDGPVLASADVSMTVKGATELANSAADLILTEPSLAGVWKAMDLAREARRTVRQNMAWAIGYNTLALPLAVAGVLQPWMAALGMSASSLLVVANSARLAGWGRSRSVNQSDRIAPVPREARA
jgi:Cu2+-exporting ATPase